MNTSMNKQKRCGSQRGVTLIELLVALVIFSFGMLGLAGLQSRTLAFGQSSLLRSQATALGDDIIDRMRADRTNALSGRWTTDFTDTSNTITGTSLAETEMKDWKTQVETLLPMGGAKIEVTSATTGTIKLTIQWDDTRSGSASQSFETITRL